MKVVDGVYTGFVIMDEKDILELRHMIKNYKPISKNDIAFLLQKLEKKGKKHLIPFFEEHIIEKDIHQNPQVSTTLPKKKKTKAIETYQKTSERGNQFALSVFSLISG